MRWFKSKEPVVDQRVGEQLLEVRQTMKELEALACALREITASLDLQEQNHGGV